ncbi:hypothetical protein BC941DRAFT_408561 [Chlamydoabsidia padenii]|nr:hypothetical protein BC941DRAFT_408561 [Chlamydoabsidia padenii]
MTLSSSNSATTTTTPATMLSTDSRPKGGRRRQYSNEQRKDRNRQAQAAFRERRSKHTKALEDTITDLRTLVHILQQNATQAMERAKKAEKRSQQLELECHHVKSILGCLLPGQSPPPPALLSPLYSEQCTMLSTPIESSPSLLDDYTLWENNLIGSSTSITSLGEFTLCVMNHLKITTLQH